MSVIIRLQNLPWNANALDIRQFFYGLSIPDGGVHIIGGEKGDAFIAFSTDEDARRAMMNDGGKINDLPIRLFLSSKNEMQSVILAARGAPQPPVGGPVPNEPFGRPALGEGFGSSAAGGFDFLGQRNRGGPPAPVGPVTVPFGMGVDKRDNRMIGLGQSNAGVRFPEFGGGGVELRAGSDGGVRPPFGGRPSFDARPPQDSKLPSMDSMAGGAVLGGPGPLRAFGGNLDQLVGGSKVGPFGEAVALGNAGGNWGFPSAAREPAGFPGHGGGFGERGMLEQERALERDIPNRDMQSRIREEILGNPDVARFGFGRPDDGFGKQEFGRDFRKFPDQPGAEFMRNEGVNEFGQRQQGLEFDRGMGKRQDFGRPDMGSEFRGVPEMGRAEGGFPRDDRMRRFGDEPSFGRNENDGRDFMRQREFGAPDLGRGSVGAEFSGRADVRPDFPRQDMGRGFPGPDPNPGFNRSDVGGDRLRTDEGRLGMQFSRPDFPRPEGMGREFGRDGPEGSRMGNTNFDPRDIPFGRGPLDDRQGFGMNPTNNPFAGPGPNIDQFGMRAGEPGRPMQPGGNWRDEQREREMMGIPGRRTPPREFVDRFPGGGFGSMGRRDERGFGGGDGMRGDAFNNSAGVWVRVSNLPLSFNYREVRRFFSGCDMPTDGLKLVNNPKGKRTGLAYIKFKNVYNVIAALKFDGRVVENCRVMVEKCSGAEFEDAVDGFKPLQSRSRSRSPLRKRSSDRDLCVVLKKVNASTTESDIRGYFSKSCIAKNGGPFLEIGNDGLKTGSALIEFERAIDFEEALLMNKRSKILKGVNVKVIGIKKGEFEDRTRKIRNSEKESTPSGTTAAENKTIIKSEAKGAETSESKASTQDKDKLEKSESADGKPCCVELQGVPWTTTVATVKDFFKGLNITDNGIHVILDKEGRAAGPVYVEFSSSTDCMKALGRNRQYIGKRYINVVLIGKKQVLAAINRSQTSTGGGAAANPTATPSSAAAQAPAKPATDSGKKSEEVIVSLKNLSFQTQLEDILEFFHGYHPIVDSIKLQYKDGKPTGDGLTSFPNLQEAESVVRLLSRKPLLGRPVLLALWQQN